MNIIQTTFYSNKFRTSGIIYYFIIWFSLSVPRRDGMVIRGRQPAPRHGGCNSSCNSVIYSNLLWLREQCEKVLLKHCSHGELIGNVAHKVYIYNINTIRAGSNEGEIIANYNKVYDTYRMIHQICLPPFFL